MAKLTVAVVAAVLGMASASLYAEEVKLTDQDRLELRQRADSLRASDMLGRDHAMHPGGDHRMKHGKKHSKKHARRHTQHASTQRKRQAESLPFSRTGDAANAAGDCARA